MLVERLIQSLSEAGSDDFSAQLVTLVVDDLLELRVGDLVEPGAVADQLITALGSPGLNLMGERHLIPLVDHERGRVSASAETLRGMVPKAVVTGIEERMRRPTNLPDGFGTDIVDPAFVRQLIAASLGETLEAFLAKLPFGGGAKDGEGSLLGTIARKGASRFKSAGTALSSIGSGVQEGLKRQAKEFAQQSADRLKQGVVERFNSPENKAALQQMRRRALDSVLNTQLSDLYALVDDPGTERLLEWGNLTLQHNLDRPEVQQAIREQIELAFVREQERSAKAMLEEFDVYGMIRTHLIAIASTRAREFVQTKAFETWLSQLVSKAIS